MLKGDQPGPNEQAEEGDKQRQMVETTRLFLHDVPLPKGFEEKEFGSFRDIVYTGGRRSVLNPIPPFVGEIEWRTKEGREQEDIHHDLARQGDIPQNFSGDLFHAYPPIRLLFVSALRRSRKGASLEERGHRLDNAVVLESSQIAFCQTQQGAENIGIVLPQERSRMNLGRRI